MIAQVAAASAYLAVVARAVRREGAPVRPHADGIRANATVGSRLVVRTGALLVTLLTATAIASRFGDDDVAAQQVAMQVFLLLALALDAGDRRAGDGGPLPRRRRPPRRPGRRPAWWSSACWSAAPQACWSRYTPVAGIAVHQ